MKTLHTISWSNTGCLFKLCSGWQGASSCLSHCVLKTQIRTLSRPGTLQNTQHVIGKLLSGTNHVSQLSYIPLTEYPSDIYTDVCSRKNKHITQRTSGLHTWCKMTALGRLDSGRILKDVYNKNNCVFSHGWSRSSRSEKDGGDKTDEDTDKLEHRKRMQGLSADNDMLSRFRNTYIMTLVCLASLQNEFSPLPSTIAAVAITTSEMNLSFGTVVYISNLIKLRKSDKISGIYFTGCVAFAALHFVLWSLLLALIFPGGNTIDTELKHYTGEH